MIVVALLIVVGIDTSASDSDPLCREVEYEAMKVLIGRFSSAAGARTVVVPGLFNGLIRKEMTKVAGGVVEEYLGKIEKVSMVDYSGCAPELCSSLVSVLDSIAGTAAGSDIGVYHSRCVGALGRAADRIVFHSRNDKSLIIMICTCKLVDNE